MLKAILFIVGLGIFSIAYPSAVLTAEHDKIDVTGDWHVDIERGRRCRWQGQVRLDQNGDQLSGNGHAAAPPAQRFCPRLEGVVEGSVNGPVVKFGFATGRLGTGEFDGSLTPDGRMLNGTWSAGAAAGTWRAERVD